MCFMKCIYQACEMIGESVRCKSKFKSSFMFIISITSMVVSVIAATFVVEILKTSLN